MLNEYHRLVGIKENQLMKQTLGHPRTYDDLFIDQALGMTEELMNKIRTIMEQNSTDGRIYPFIAVEPDGKIDFELIFDGGRKG